MHRSRPFSYLVTLFTWLTFVNQNMQLDGVHTVLWYTWRPPHIDNLHAEILEHHLIFEAERNEVPNKMIVIAMQLVIKFTQFPLNHEHKKHIHVFVVSFHETCSTPDGLWMSLV